MVKGDRQTSTQFPRHEVQQGLLRDLLAFAFVGSNPTSPTNSDGPGWPEHGAGQVEALRAVRSSQRHAVLSQAKTPLRVIAVIWLPIGRCTLAVRCRLAFLRTMLRKSAAQPRRHGGASARQRVSGQRQPHSLTGP